MATIEMKITVRDVRLLVKADWPLSINRARVPLTITSIRLDQADAEILGLLEGETLAHIEHAITYWADTSVYTPELPRLHKGVTHG